MGGEALEGWDSFEYGRSREGVALRAFRPADAKDHPVAGLITAGVHGEEALTSLVIRRLLERVPGTQTGWVVVPVINPDGVLAGTRQNAAGVDINRNFPASTWRPDPSYTYPPGIDPELRVAGNRTNLSSPGTEAASEPETRGLIELVERLAPALVIDVHTPLELLFPRAGVPATVVNELARAADVPIVEEMAPCPGAFDDWLEENGIPAIVYELEQTGLPAACVRHLRGLEALLLSRE